MPSKTALVFLLVWALVDAASSARALELGLPINGAVSANAKMLTNPPLPMIYYKKGTYKLNLEPDFFSGHIDGDNSDTGSHDRADIKGAGGGFSFSWAYKDRWGLYVYGMGNKSSASNITQTPLPGNVQTTATFGNTHATFEAISVGFVHQFFGENFEGFSLPVFFGPMLAHVKMDPTTTHVTNVNGGVTQTDIYDVSVDNYLPGAMVGMQSAFNIGKGFQLNPFAVMAFMAKQADPVLTNIKQQQSQNTPMATITNGFGGFGLNLVYRPWGVSANLTAPLFDRIVNVNGPKNFSGSLISLSWSFGNYIK